VLGVISVVIAIVVTLILSFPVAMEIVKISLIVGLIGSVLNLTVLLVVDTIKYRLRRYYGTLDPADEEVFEIENTNPYPRCSAANNPGHFDYVPPGEQRNNDNPAKVKKPMTRWEIIHTTGFVIPMIPCAVMFLIASFAIYSLLYFCAVIAKNIEPA
jgi:hypothetical protein